jgi:hypothetical protein
MSDHAEWLASLKTGDTVALRGTGGFGRDVVSIVKIAHATKTQIVAGKTRFRRATGFALGSGYQCSFIAPPSPELRERALRLRRLSMIEGVNFHDLTDDQLARISAIVSELKVSA